MNPASLFEVIIWILMQTTLEYQVEYRDPPDFDDGVTWGYYRILDKLFKAAASILSLIHI